MNQLTGILQIPCKYYQEYKTPDSAACAIIDAIKQQTETVPRPNPTDVTTDVIQIQTEEETYTASRFLTEEENFIANLIHNIKIKLRGLFNENFLYSIIYSFLYSSTKLLYRIEAFTRINHSVIELPITGTNYIITYQNDLHIEQIEQNKFKIFSKGDIIFEIMGDYDTIDYDNYNYPRGIMTMQNILTVESKNKLKKVINYGTNPYLKMINMTGTRMRLPNIIPNIETFICHGYTFSYGENITSYD